MHLGQGRNFGFFKISVCEMVSQCVRNIAHVEITIRVLNDDVVNCWFIADWLGTIKDYYLISSGTCSLCSGATELFTFSYAVFIVST